MNFLKKGIKQSSGFLPLGGGLPNLTYFKGEERGWASTRLAGFSFLLRFKGHASNERGFFRTAKRTKPLFHFSQKKKPNNFKKRRNRQKPTKLLILQIFKSPFTHDKYGYRQK